METVTKLKLHDFKKGERCNGDTSDTQSFAVYCFQKTGQKCSTCEDGCNSVQVGHIVNRRKSAKELNV